ncbi:hypothetical protein EV426DRAFT_686773 [Tirmania nivea]|nr:hypothetical protein EV426DRAFT_686773 [Tirmania nivea]
MLRCSSATFCFPTRHITLRCSPSDLMLSCSLHMPVMFVVWVPKLRCSLTTCAFPLVALSTLCIFFSPRPPWSWCSCFHCSYCSYCSLCSHHCSCSCSCSSIILVFAHCSWLPSCVLLSRRFLFCRIFVVPVSLLGSEANTFRQPGEVLPRYLFFSSQRSRPSVSLFLVSSSMPFFLRPELHAVDVDAFRQPSEPLQNSS